MKLLYKSRYINLGEEADCYYAFFKLDGVIYSVHRRHKLFSYYEWPSSAASVVSKLILTTYQITTDGELLEINERELCDGEDPRVISDGVQAYILAKGSIHSDKEYLLIKIPSAEIVTLAMVGGKSFGKNWQPYLYNNKLYVLNSFAPPKIYEVNTSTGLVKKVWQGCLDYDSVAPHDQYSTLRGGTNGIQIKDNIVGWGHMTTKPYKHAPFFWQLTHGSSIEIRFADFAGPFFDLGYSVVDPVSVLRWDKKNFAISLCCSNRDWFFPQNFSNFLLIIPQEQFPPNNFSSLRFQLEQLQHVKLLHCDELPSLIESELVHGSGRSSQGSRGCLVCGPSDKIDLHDEWEIELVYSSPEELEMIVGDFDVYLHEEKREYSVAQMQLKGTLNTIRTCKLLFGGKEKNSLAIFQSRVFADTGKRITAFYFVLTAKSQSKEKRVLTLQGGWKET